MSATENFMKKVRAKEYAEIEAKEKAIQESAQLHREYVAKKAAAIPFPIQKMRYSYDVAKAVMNECFCDIYMNSLIIDEPEKYESVLREAATQQFNDLIKDCKNINDVKSLFENACHYVKQMIVLAESIGNDKAEKLNPNDEAFKPELIIDSEDKKLIEDFEKIEGAKDYGDAIQDRVVDVFKAEQKLGEDRKDKAQKLINDLANKDNSLTESAIERGLNAFPEIPKTLFQSIFINRSKMTMNESASMDLMNSADEILAETIVTYTLLECVSALGLKTFNSEDVRSMKINFHVGS